MVAAVSITVWIYLFDYSKDLQAWRQNTEMLRHAIDYITVRFQAAISLMLGFYTMTLFNRWWAVRIVMQDISSSIKDAAIQLGIVNNCTDKNDNYNDSSSLPETTKVNGHDHLNSTYVPPEQKKDEATMPSKNGNKTIQNNKEKPKQDDPVRKIGLTMVRWLNLAHAVAIGDLIEKWPNDFSTTDDLERLGLISKHEIYLFSQTSDETKYFAERYSRCWGTDGGRSRRRRYDIPVAWFYEYMYEIERMDTIRVPPVCLGILDRSVSRMRQSLDTLYVYKDTNVPIMYRQLVQLTVRLYMVIFLIGDGLLALYHAISLAETEAEAVLEILGEEAEEEYLRENLTSYFKSLYFMILPFAFEYFVFVGWMSAADALGNPFRDWADSLEWEANVKATFTDSAILADNVVKGLPKVADLMGKDKKDISIYSIETNVKILPLKKKKRQFWKRIRKNLTGF
jgi:hypothetical protein